jgi:hypothetical protein
LRVKIGGVLRGRGHIISHRRLPLNQRSGSEPTRSILVRVREKIQLDERQPCDSDVAGAVLVDVALTGAGVVIVCFLSKEHVPGVYDGLVSVRFSTASAGFFFPLDLVHVTDAGVPGARRMALRPQPCM